MHRFLTKEGIRHELAGGKAFVQHEYIIEHAYGRGLFCTTSYNVVTNQVKELAMSFKFLMMPGGCIYADNEF